MIGSLPISWISHPFMALIEPPSLPVSPTKGCCDWTEVSLSSHVSLPTLKAIQKSERHGYRLLIRDHGAWFMWLPRFHTSRVINVPAKLLFCCQDSAREKLFKILFDFPLLSTGNEITKLQGFIFRFSLFSAFLPKFYLLFRSSFVEICHNL